MGGGDQLGGKLEISRPLLGIHHQWELVSIARSRVVCSDRNLAWEVAPSTELTQHSKWNADSKGLDRTSNLAFRSVLVGKPIVGWKMRISCAEVDNLKVGSE